MKKSKKADIMNTAPKWFDLAIAACEDSEEKIPCMTGMMKGEEKADIRFRGLARTQKMAEICTGRSSRFKTITDFNRAAHYIGCLVIYNMCKDDLVGEDRMWGAALLESCRLSERPMMTAILYDRVLDTLAGIKKVFNKGLCSAEEMNDRADHLIASLPENMRKAARMDFQNIMNGKKISEMYLSDHHGGVRS